MQGKSLRRNKVYGRVKQPFGLKPSMLIGMMSVFAIGAMLSFVFPAKVAWSIFAVVFLWAGIVLSGGAGSILAKLHKPRHYTRAGDRYISPLGGSDEK